MTALAPAVEAALQLEGTEEPYHSVVAVLESAWLPVMLVPLGPDLWSRGHAGQLLRHRFGDVHGLDGQTEVHMDFRAGEAQVLGYALARPVKEALLSSAMAAAVEVASLQPAFVWGREFLSRRGGRQADGHGDRPGAWWVWSEQDRTLVALLRDGRVMSLNPGASQVSDLEGAKRCAALESLRLGGLMKDAPVLAAGWPGQPLGDSGAG
ncbi:hypothetical protein H5407_17345 [Mitsuaria sp. WAJ17]|uniref:hypothetical protein n=1 Tax=Mitsuaria sp. WAJ17 TaxID=2761452 RepID=UPI001600BDB3|nr:hypothetical protein [Mitsuaria sp. WAJ17]MBB2486997.1 hypothetical protein [Mitsuaria sp. WAJ17]